MNTNPTEMAEREERVNAAIADYLDSVHAGQTLNEDEFLASHVDIASEIEEFLADREQFQRIAGSLGPPLTDLAAPVGQPTLRHESADRGMTVVAYPGKAIRYFGDYVLLEEIARGGMGVIYKARQTRLNRIVVVKLILAGQLASDDDVKRFYTEAKAAAGLQHPNIVTIYEVGEHEGQHFFSMEYVNGVNLTELTKRGPLPFETAADYVKTIAEAIHYAHQQGTLHRDGP